MKDFRRFLGTSVLWLLADDQIDVHVRVNEVAVGRSTHGSLIHKMGVKCTEVRGNSGKWGNVENAYDVTSSD